MTTLLPLILGALFCWGVWSIDRLPRWAAVPLCLWIAACSVWLAVVLGGVR